MRARGRRRSRCAARAAAGLLAVVAVAAPGAAARATATDVVVRLGEAPSYFSALAGNPLVVGLDGTVLLPSVEPVGASWLEPAEAVLVDQHGEHRAVDVAPVPGTTAGSVDLAGVPAGEHEMYVDTYGTGGAVSFTSGLELSTSGPAQVEADLADLTTTRLQGYLQRHDAAVRPGEVVRLHAPAGRDLGEALVLLVLVHDEDYTFYPQHEIDVRARPGEVSFQVPGTPPRGDGLTDLIELGMDSEEARLALPGAARPAAGTGSTQHAVSGALAAVARSVADRGVEPPEDASEPGEALPVEPVQPGGPGTEPAGASATGSAVDASPPAPAGSAGTADALQGEHEVYLSVLLPQAAGPFGPSTLDYAVDGLVIDAGAPAPVPAPAAAPRPAAPRAAASRPTPAPTPPADAPSLNPGLVVDTGVPGAFHRATPWAAAAGGLAVLAVAAARPGRRARWHRWQVRADRSGRGC